MRLIDADALLESMAIVAKKMARSDAQKALMGRVMYILEHRAEQVVRCKDCAKWSSYKNTAGAGYCHNKNFCFRYGIGEEREFVPITMPDDFCSHGERKENHETD